MELVGFILDSTAIVYLSNHSVAKNLPLCAEFILKTLHF